MKLGGNTINFRPKDESFFERRLFYAMETAKGEGRRYLHYLGSQMMDELLHKQVEEMMTLLNQDVRCQVIYRTLPLENHQCRYIKLQGKSIQALLKESHAVIIMAAT